MLGKMASLRLFQSTSVRVCGFSHVLLRGLSCSAALEMKKPVFDGPLPPKRPPSAYFLFKDHNSDTLAEMCSSKREENPVGHFREKAKIAGAQWKKMDSTEREPYQKEYTELKQSYEKEVQKFYDSFSKKQLEEYNQKWNEYHTKFRKYKDWLADRIANKDKRKKGKVMGYSLFVSDKFKDRPEDVLAKVRLYEDYSKRVEGTGWR
ncbi:uncharacterized protein [Dysidea avara]|uniref:uncharacterized protein isoform X2 n=1 Tax=Dysidea avara TaxID=196820 RepID=UPI003317C88B